MNCNYSIYSNLLVTERPAEANWAGSQAVVEGGPASHVEGLASGTVPGVEADDSMI